MEILYRLLLVVLILGFSKSLYAYDFIDSLNSDIAIKKASIFHTKDELSAQKIYTLYKIGEFKPLPKRAKSFGLDRGDHWFAFEIESFRDDSFMDIRNTSLQESELFFFKDGELKRSEIRGYAFNDDRIRFALRDLDGVYFIRVFSNSPRFVAFGVGSEVEVENHHNSQFSLFAFTSGVFLFALVFNLFLVSKLRERIYLYYIIHITGLYLSIIITIGYTEYLPLFKTPVWVLIAMELQFIGLVLFSDIFLKLKNYPKARRAIFYVLYLNIAILFLTLYYDFALEVVFYFLLVLFGMLFYGAVKISFLGAKYARYYVIGTGVSILMMILYTLTHKGYLPYTCVTFNLLHFALIWDALFLTFAIVSRVNTLQEENLQKERILKLKARQDTISSMMGNIAHQWRSPLSQVGALVTTLRAKLEYSNISIDENIEYLDSIGKKLKFLSQTVDTFQNFSIQNESRELFSLNRVITDIVAILSEEIKRQKIDLKLTLKDEVYIDGDKNLISQVVLVLIQNAKEAIIESKKEGGEIEVLLLKKGEESILEISDNGKKIDYEYSKKIFDPFFTTKKEGSGIGLYLAKKIVEENFDGRLELELEDGRKVFSVIL